MKFDVRDGLNSDWLSVKRKLKRMNPKQRKIFIRMKENERYRILTPAEQRKLFKGWPND